MRRTPLRRCLTAALASAVTSSLLVLLAPTAASAAALGAQDLGSGAFTASDLAQGLAGDGVTVSNVSVGGAGSAAGRFTGGAAAGLGIDSGVVLSSGAVGGVAGTPGDFRSTSHGSAGDADLDALTPPAVYDAAVLEFDFVPNGDTVYVEYVFASEEYPEYANSQYEDVFGFFVNGTNCATVDGGRVTINTINHAVRSALYRDGSTVASAMDGLTVVLVCEATVVPGVTNHMKLGIADGADDSYDSTVFVKAGSFSTTPPDADSDSVPDAGDNCPSDANTDQVDSDADGIGDACETNTPPTIDAGSAVTSEATGPSGAVVTYVVPNAVDAEDGPLTPVCAPVSGSGFPLGGSTVTCTATDSAGESASTQLTVEVVDTTAPTVHVGDATVEATGPLTPVSYAFAAHDAVGIASTSCSTASGSAFPLGATAVQCTAKDLSGQEASDTGTITVLDTTAPAVDPIGDVTAEATGPAGAMVHFTPPTAHDAVSGSSTTTCSAVPGALFLIGTTTVTCSATDSSGNTGSTSLAVTVSDTTPPTLALPGDITQEAEGPDGAHVSFSTSATDVVDLDVPVTCSPGSGVFPLGSTPVGCDATDDAGNSASGGFDVIVQDTLAPVFALGAQDAVEATGPLTPVSLAVAAADVVSGAVQVLCSPADGSGFPVGITAVQCSATDAAGNTAEIEVYAVVEDTTPPALALPDDLVVEATGAGGAAVEFATSAADLVDGDVTPVCVPASGSTFAIGSTLVECSATDSNGNQATGSFEIEVVDTTAPDLAVPDDQTIEATGPDGATARFTASATDVVDPAPAVACVPPSEGVFPLGPTVVECSATDAAGNVATGSFTVTVVDTTAPVVTFSGNAGTYGVDDTVAIACSVQDIVTLGLTCEGVAGAAHTFGVGDETVSRSVADAAGNVGSGSTSFTVTVDHDSLCGLVRQVVTKAGVARSMCQQLAAAEAWDRRGSVRLEGAQLRAFRHHVDAQTGKSVTAANAALLKQLSLLV